MILLKKVSYVEKKIWVEKDKIEEKGFQKKKFMGFIFKKKKV